MHEHLRKYERTSEDISQTIIEPEFLCHICLHDPNVIRNKTNIFVSVSRLVVVVGWKRWRRQLNTVPYKINRGELRKKNKQERNVKGNPRPFLKKGVILLIYSNVFKVIFEYSLPYRSGDIGFWSNSKTLMAGCQILIKIICLKIH